MATPRKDAPPKPRRSPKKPPAKEPDLEAAAEAAGRAAVTEKNPPPPPGPDAPPEAPEKPKRRESKRTQARVTAQIESALAEILTMPAVPAAMFGDEWLSTHFADQGKALAKQIAAVSERNEVLRSWCVRAMEGESIAVLLIASVMYVYPPLVHFGVLPGPAGLLGIPVLRRPVPVPIVPEPPVAAAPEEHFPEVDPELVDMLDPDGDYPDLGDSEPPIAPV